MDRGFFISLMNTLNVLEGANDSLNVVVIMFGEMFSVEII